MADIKFSKLQKETLLFFSRNPFGQNFYWTGGTLLAYEYLHHRLSVDLDFFSDDLYADNDYLIFINNLKKQLQADRISLTEQNNRRLHEVIRGREAIKLELVYFPFPAVGRRSRLKDFSLKIDSLSDIMTNKVLSAYQRKEPKDIYDLYFYLRVKPKLRLDDLIRLAERKFGVAIEPSLFLAKAYELADSINVLNPLLIKPEKNLAINIKAFLQKEFDRRLKRIVK